MKKNRSELKGYFKKGGVPSEENFADLIDSTFNQEEDGISKSPDGPLSIIATGTDETLLNFYQAGQSENQLTWQIQQKPDQKAGLSISDAATSRLFIESGTGNIGLGTTTPQWGLDVKTANGIKLGLEGKGGGQLILANNANDNKIYLEAFSTDGSTSADELLLTGIHAKSAPKISLIADTTQISGNLGVGTDSPDAKLHVAGAQDRVSLHVGHGGSSGGDFTMDVATGQGLVSLVAGAKITPDGKGYTFLGTRGASKISLHDGEILFFTSDATDGTAGADVTGLSGITSAKMALTSSGDLQLSGNHDFITRLGLLRMGTTDGSKATKNQVMGAIGFWGFGVQHGQLSFRAGAGFELVDRSTNGPSLDYDRDAYPYADLKIQNLVTTGDIQAAGNLSVSGNVGIGTTSPNYKLEVAGDISVGQKTDTPATGYGARLHFNGASENSDPIWMARYNQASNTTYLRINLSDDNAGDQLQVGYTYYRDGNWRTSFFVDTSGTYSSSDERLKTEIDAISEPLKKLNQIRGVQFYWKRQLEQKKQPVSKSYGVIAQEVEKAVPNVVSTDQDGFKFVNYDGLVPLLIESIKSQQGLIEKLQMETQTLRQEMATGRGKR